LSIALSQRATKLITLLKHEGFRSTQDFLEARGHDSVCPGICRNRGCDYVVEVEGDQRAAWCDECDDNTVVSLLILADAI
jgi:hypothetical protein